MIHALIIVLLILPFLGNAQLTGKWKTISDQDGTEKSIVEIYEKDGLLFGKVVKLLPAAKDRHCTRCPGDMKNTPIEGMVILKNLVRTGNGLAEGKVIDPGTGKAYNCMLQLQDSDTVKIRGYVGVPTIGRTQYWKRVL